MSDARQPTMDRPKPAGTAPAFTTGSIRRHILVMTGSSAIGLMSIFIGDLANIYFLGLLGDVEIVAAVGYASTILFFATSIGIGLAIAATALVAPALGAGDRDRARTYAASALVFTLAISTIAAGLLWLLAPDMLRLLGATGRTMGLAKSYLNILLPFLVPLATAMMLAGILRSVGDASRAMAVTLGGAIVNIGLDPLLIFGFGLGLEGAAWASALARIVMAAIGVYAVIKVHNLLGRLDTAPLATDAPRILTIAVPAVLANLAAPFAAGYVTSVIATYGDQAVAANTIISRLSPVAFGAIFALSGAIGPIIGQNWGARDGVRMRATLTEGLLVTVWFTLGAWLLLALTVEPVVRAMHATKEAADLVRLFCYWLAPLFVFLGALFVCNAVFNTLRRPHYSTMFNWTRATLGTIPFVIAGAHYAGAAGVIAGSLVGQVLIGSIAVVVCYRLIDQLAREPVKVEPS